MSLKTFPINLKYPNLVYGDLFLNIIIFQNNLAVKVIGGDDVICMDIKLRYSDLHGKRFF